MSVTIVSGRPDLVSRHLRNDTRPVDPHCVVRRASLDQGTKGGPSERTGRRRGLDLHASLFRMAAVRGIRSGPGFGLLTVRPGYVAAG